jgi:hypothetical protein
MIDSVCPDCVATEIRRVADRLDEVHRDFKSTDSVDVETQLLTIKRELDLLSDTVEQGGLCGASRRKS